MKGLTRFMKRMWLGASAIFLLGAGGSCLPDNIWADILGGSLITGGIEAARNTALVAAGLQTP